MTIPICCITGRIAGDSDACGDCDPCYAAHAVPEVVKRLLGEKDEWRERYGDAMSRLDIARAERLKLDRRIHNQRRALHETWEIVESRRKWLGSETARRMYVTLLKRYQKLMQSTSAA